MKKVGVIFLAVVLFFYNFSLASATTGTFNIKTIDVHEPLMDQYIFQLTSSNYNPSTPTFADCWIQMVNIDTHNYTTAYLPSGGGECNQSAIWNSTAGGQPDGNYYINVCKTVNGQITSDCWRSQNFTLSGGVYTELDSPTRYTGCLDASNHTLYNIASGSAPFAACNGGDQQISANYGDITSVTAGDGLIGGAENSAATFNLADNGVTTAKLADLAVTTAKRRQRHHRGQTGGQRCNHLDHQRPRRHHGKDRRPRRHHGKDRE